jgi:hypothetical protein
VSINQHGTAGCETDGNASEEKGAPYWFQTYQRRTLRATSECGRIKGWPRLPVGT